MVSRECDHCPKLYKSQMSAFRKRVPLACFENPSSLGLGTCLKQTVSCTRLIDHTSCASCFCELLHQTSFVTYAEMKKSEQPQRLNPQSESQLTCCYKPIRLIEQKNGRIPFGLHN